MKKTIALLFISILAIIPKAYAEDFCQEKLFSHLEMIATTSEYIANVGTHSKKITAFEITQFQKKMTKRYLSFLDLLAAFNNESNDCKPYVLVKAVAVYDFEDIQKIVFKNNHLRRVFYGFIKHNDYQLNTYLRDYEKYTSKAYAQEVLTELENGEVILPGGVQVKKSKHKTDPNLRNPIDRMMKQTTKLVSKVAKVVGFVSDRFQWREGRLKDNSAAKELILSKVKPLDLIFEQRQFTLSNYTIPGHWGHVGIWLGTKEELIAMNIWDQEYFKIFKKYVEEGYNIVEIRKTGLNFQKLDTYLNLDEIAVTRIANANQKAQEVFAELNTQISKNYDFEFNARSADKITCTELIAFSYGDIIWPETKTLFQVNLRPDDLAKLSLNNSGEEELIVYIRGNKKAPMSVHGFDDWKKVLEK